ncbi:unnamed protein product [Hermetia illucens]|uniref:Uncharacterized protein n=2 Tax=Hermetia illucens TaxID=343691 RepID=A0A7R8UYG3_HERIL|nr:unnamed protein product [Hermetia illucens]
MASKIVVVLCAFVAAANAGYLAAPVASYGAPVASYGAPVASYAAPAALHYAAAAPVVKYSPATAVSHSYSSIAAPAALTYAAPVAKAVSYAPAGVAVSAPAIGSTQQNVVRSFGGTVSQYSKAVDTAFSSVRKYDTRVSNNVYTPAIAKTLAYAAPAPAYVAHAAPAVVAHAAPAVVAHAAPVAVAHAAPAILAGAPATAYASKAVSYSPAATVAHVAFDGLGVHYGW